MSYLYDADGIRTQKTVDGVTTQYFVSGSTILAEKTGNDVLWYMYDSDGDILGFTYNGTPYYYIKNMQGDICKVVNESGTVVASYTYDAWGKVLTATGSMAEINPIRYRGYYYDAETGFYYLNSRYYDPEVGRFINTDNINLLGANGDFASLNLFAYCGNNPITRADNGGGFWNIVIGAVAGGVAGCVVSVVTQMIENKSWDLNRVNLESVVVATVSGAVSGAFAATGIPVEGQIAINAAIGVVSSVVDTSIEKGNQATATDYVSSIITGGIVGVIGGVLGGDGSGTKHLSKSAGRLFKKVGSALTDVFNNNIKTTLKTIANAGKYYYSQIASQSIQCGQKAIKPIIISNLPNAICKICEALE